MEPGTDFVLDTEDVRAMVDLGFMALSAGLSRDAEAIFEGVRAARPEQEAGMLGLAMVRLAENRPEAAVMLLKPLAPSEAVLTYLGLAQARCGEKHAAGCSLRGVIASAPGTPFAELAGAAISQFNL
ncbi:MAG: hypothetical protein ACOH2J_16690 [Allorhizobium sp.]